jgi:dihydroorotase
MSQYESILFKSVDMVLPEGIRNGDLLVEHGKITQIAPSLPTHAELILTEPSLTLMPGVIDPHVHFRDPGLPHKETLETGSKAALSGGVTSFLDMPNTIPAATTQKLIDDKKKIASETSRINYGFFIGATTDNIEDLRQVTGIPGIKVFMGSSTGSLLVDDPTLLAEIFSTTPHLIAVHAEDEAMVLANQKKYQGSTDAYDHCRIRTPEAALKATQFACELSQKYNKRLHIVHLTTAEEAQYLSQIKSGTRITTEVCPQHLFLAGRDMYTRLGNLAKINPPLRGESRHPEALWKALLEGTIDCIATDHAPHLLSEKSQPFEKAPAGMPGVETSLMLMLTRYNQGLCTLEQIVEWMCAAPARVYNIRGKGQLKIGLDADLTWVDLKAKRTLSNHTQHTRAGWTAFDGETVQGIPIATLVNGQIGYREGDFFEVRGEELRFN